jgi:hypothetical protein
VLDWRFYFFVRCINFSDQQVQDQHLQLYVTTFSTDIDVKGIQAVESKWCDQFFFGPHLQAKAVRTPVFHLFAPALDTHTLGLQKPTPSSKRNELGILSTSTMVDIRLVRMSDRPVRLLFKSCIGVLPNFGAFCRPRKLVGGM